MGLYVSILLLAALTATDESGHGSDFNAFAIVWGTTVGTAAAHWFAFVLAAHLADPDLNRAHLKEELWAELCAAAGVAALVSMSILLFPDSMERAAARLTAALCIGGLAAAETRANGASRRRSLAFGAMALAVGLVVAGVEHKLTH